VPPSKEELAAYWAKVWKRALPHLGRRPLKLVRHVRGTTFYHKGKLPPVPDAVHRLTIEKREGGEGTRLWVDDLAGLLGLIEIDTVELHPWNARIDDIEHPDLLVFDLDPGEGVAWEFVIETALTLRRMLKGEGTEAVAKADRGQGIASDGTACPDDRPRPGASLRQADRARPRCNRTGPVHDLLRPGKARRAHLHRLSAERPRHDGDRNLVTAGAGGIPGGGPGELAARRERDPSGHLYNGQAAAQIARLPTRASSGPSSIARGSMA
jgi:hypothetical protein